MADAKTLARLEKLIWVLIYGGLLTLVLGVATLGGSPATGWTLMIGGSVVAVAGAALIFVRARLGGPP